MIGDIQSGLFTALMYGLFFGVILSVIRWFIFSGFREV